MPPIELEDLTPQEALVPITWTPEKLPGVDRAKQKLELTLREMTCENHVIEYAKRIQQATRDHNSELRPVLGQAEAIPRAMEAFYDGQAEVVEWLFSLCEENEVPELAISFSLEATGDVANPAVITEYRGRLARVAWIRKHVSYRMRAKIIETQDLLNGMSDIVGNAQNLLLKAETDRQADQLIEANREVLEATRKEIVAEQATSTASTSKPGKGKGIGKLTTVR